MREVFTDIDSAKVGFYKSALEQAGIPCFVRNEFSNTSMSSIPSHLFYPTLCVTDDDDFEAAVEVLRNFHNNPPPLHAPWLCPKCGEEVPGNFEECWQCGAPQAEPA